MTRDLRNAANQATRFGIVLERMNANAQRERNRQKRRVAALIVGFLLALAVRVNPGSPSNLAFLSRSAVPHLAGNTISSLPWSRG